MVLLTHILGLIYNKSIEFFPEEGKITLIPGYDGLYGEVKIGKREKQMTLFRC